MEAVFPPPSASSPCLPFISPPPPLLVARPRYALYTYQGSDGPDVQPTGRSQDNIFDSNTIIGGPQAIKFKESDGSIVTNNVFSDPGRIEFNDTTGNVVTGNIGLDEATEVKVTEPACFAETDEDSLAEYGCDE